MKRIIVETSRKTYPVLIGSNTLPSLKSFTGEAAGANLFVVVDENVQTLHSKKIKKAFTNHKGRIRFFTLPAGEKVKSFFRLKEIYRALLSNKFGRDTTIVAIGGGVTGDLSGYAAATFMRGVNLIHVPTTLLSCIDSSIGGKTGINFDRKKNIIGAFYQPEAVLIDTSFLFTLPLRQLISGIGEVVKYAFLADKNFYSLVDEKFDDILSLQKNVTEKVIEECVRIKCGVVEQDELETRGVRKILNLGHTFAHAFESSLGFRINHGEAVAAGVIASLVLSNKSGIISDSKLERFISLPLKVKLPASLNRINSREAYKLMIADKKAKDGEPLFVLVNDLGKILVDVKVSKREILKSIEMMKEICFEKERGKTARF